MSSPESRPGERPRRQYSFGEFTLDLDRGALTRAGEELALRSKSFEALTYLVERHGQLVTKSALVDAIWPDTAVGDNSLAQCLFEIRRALGDDSQQLIRTVARRGYIFTPSVVTPVTPVVEFPREAGLLPAQQPSRLNRKVLAASLAIIALAIIAALPLSLRRPASQQLAYEQITNFTDSAVSPALSPDGKMLAFIRSENWFHSTDQIWVKLLPDGESGRLGHWRLGRL